MAALERGTSPTLPLPQLGLIASCKPRMPPGPTGRGSHGTRLSWEAAHVAGAWLMRPALKPNHPQITGSGASSKTHAHGGRSSGSIMASQASHC